MSDRIAVMKDGVFQQVGTPSQVYDAPKTAYVAQFVGTANIVRGVVDRVDGERVTFRNEDGAGEFLSRGYGFAPGEPVALAIRGEQAQVEKAGDKPGPGLAGTVKEKSFSGGMLRICVELAGGQEFICSRHGIDWELAPGDRVRLSWEPGSACPVDREEVR